MNRTKQVRARQALFPLCLTMAFSCAFPGCEGAFISHPEGVDPEDTQAHHNSIAVQFADETACFGHNLDTTVGLVESQDVIGAQSGTSDLGDFQLVRPDKVLRSLWPTPPSLFPHS